LEEVLVSTKKRKQSDQERYQKYYQFDAYDPKNYDFVLDTTALTPEQTLNEVKKYLTTHYNLKF
jgi:cytidylate kinase